MRITKIGQYFQTRRMNRIMNKHVALVDGPITKELNKMRYPLALYAKDNKVFINMYQPNTVDSAFKNTYMLSVSSLNKNGKRESKVLQIDPDQIIIKNEHAVFSDNPDSIKVLERLPRQQGKHSDDCLSLIYKIIQDTVKKINNPY